MKREREREKGVNLKRGEEFSVCLAELFFPQGCNYRPYFLMMQFLLLNRRICGRERDRETEKKHKLIELSVVNAADADANLRDDASVATPA